MILRCLVLIPAFLAILRPTAAFAPYEAPDDCEWNFVNDESGFAGGVSLTCHLSAINSHLEKTNFSVIPSAGTRKLTVKCKEPTLSKLEARGFASLKNIEELVLDSCRLEHIPALAFDGLTRLKSLTIHSKFTNEFSMASEALSGLTSLQHLDLSGNGLRSMPPEELCHLPSLTSLDLSQNQLGSIVDLGLISASKCRLLRLETLDLSANEITTVHSHLLNAHWPQLKSLNLKNNFVRHVEAAASTTDSSSFHNKCSLDYLNLSNNQINALPSGILQHCHKLKTLDLANNSLPSLDQSFFDNLKHLQKLNLSGNRLVTIPSRQFRDLVSLTHLDLSHNQLSILTESTGLFEPMSSTMSSLRLNNNRLKTIEAKVFHTLVNLKELDLSANELAAIDRNTLEGLGRLTHLLLANNDLINVHVEAFKSVPEILVLDLSHNKLRESPLALKSLIRLQTLDLSFNSLETLFEASFLELTNLWRLQLNGNNIQNVTKTLFSKLGSLSVLDLSSNIISNVEAGSFEDNQKLSAIRLDSNSLTKIEGLFANLKNLQWLNVSSNVITKFDYNLLPVNLKWLDVSHNLIRELSNFLDLNTELALTEMDVSFNKIAQLGPHNIPDSIETLMVNDNAISQIVPYTFFKKTRLVKVDLTVNNLKQIDRNALRLSSDVTRLPDFFLTGNPIECDCEMVWFKSINSGSTLQNYPIVKDIESIYCRLVYTRQQTFIPLVEAKNEQFLCPYTTHCFALCQCCDFDACDCEMTCPDNCTCYHDSSWSKNIAECSSAGFHDLPDQLPMDATEVFLDGNVFPELDSHTFIGRKNLQILHLNNSQIHTIHNKTFNGLKALSVLHLEGNQLTSLKGYEFEGALSENLRELYLENNLLETIHNSTFKFLRNLEILHLDGNRLIDFPAWQLAFNPLLVSVKLAENLWSCECDFVQRFRAWMSVYGGKVDDAKSIECITNEAEALIISSPLMTSTNSEVQVGAGGSSRLTMCIENNNNPRITSTHRWSQREMISEDYLPLLAATLATFAFILLILLAVFVYRNTLKVWLHSKYGVRVFSDNYDIEGSSSNGGNGGEGEHNLKHFDAFISYSPKDDAFAREVLANELERRVHPDANSGYRICCHHRDLCTTNQAYFSDTIIRATEASKRTILVLSENFLKSEWSRYDYKSGLHQAMRSNGDGGRKKLIVIMLGDVANRDIDPDLRLYLKASTVLHWGDRFFWEKLRYAIPDKPKKGHGGGGSVSPTSGHSSVVSSTTSVLSSDSSLNHPPPSNHHNNQQIYHQPQPRYTMRPNLMSNNNNNTMMHQHIYNMPGPQLATSSSGANSLYGSLQGVPVHHGHHQHGGGVSPGAAVHI